MRALHALAFVLLCLVWGSTWLVIKVGYGGLGPLNVAGLRFLLAGLLMVGVVPALRARWPRGRAEWLLVLFVGSVLFAADYGLIYWGEQYLDSGLTAILFAVYPLATALLAHAYLPGERATIRSVVGTLLAFLGVVALFGESVRIDPALALPMLAIVASAVCAAAASVATKRHGHDLPAAGLNAPAMLVGAALLLLASVGVGESPRLPADPSTWWAIGYLAIAGSVITFLVFFWLLKVWKSTTLSFIAVLTPLVALVLGYVVLDEQPTVWTAAGTVLVLAGVTVALVGGRKR